MTPLHFEKRYIPPDPRFVVNENAWPRRHQRWYEKLRGSSMSMELVGVYRIEEVFKGPYRSGQPVAVTERCYVAEPPDHLLGTPAVLQFCRTGRPLELPGASWASGNEIVTSTERTHLAHLVGDGEVRTYDFWGACGYRAESMPASLREGFERMKAAEKRLGLR